MGGKLLVNGMPLCLGAGQLVGMGGEAEIYKVDAHTVLKRYKDSTHPDYAGDKAAQAAAKARIDEQQRKLSMFPRGLPMQVVAPTALAYDATGGRVLGFTMPFAAGMNELMHYGVRSFREGGGIDSNQVLDVFRSLRRVVEQIHSSGVVIGDFNDLNVMTDGSDVRIIDADSMQFGSFLCHTFTNRFVDPLRCQADKLVLAKPHTMESDWYAYFVMLLQSLLYVGPFGGVHRPQAGKRLTFDDRVLKRVTFLDKDVVYPKPAVPYMALSDELLGYLEKVFVHDARMPFPAGLLDALRFTTCGQCGTIHARSVCPQCSAPGAPQKVMTVRGQVTVRNIFTTKGRILQAVYHHGALRFLYQENGALYREGGRRLMSAELSPELRFRIQDDTTYIGTGSVLLAVDADGNAERTNVASYRDRLPVFDTNEAHVYWEYAGQLLENGRIGPKYIGDVLAGQTLLWVGNHCGFGMYQAGGMTRGLLFMPGKTGINDRVDVPLLPGQLTDATAYFGADKVWFMTASQVAGKLVHACSVFGMDGALLANEQAEQGSDSWLGRSIRGHLAVGRSLFVGTDEGIARIGIAGGQLIKEREFPDTEPFVDGNCYLVAGPGGIYVVSTHEIVLVQIH